MTYATERERLGRLPAWTLEIDLPRCTRTYGTSPCTASVGTTGSAKCFNTRVTCQDTANYAADTRTYRFANRELAIDAEATPAAVTLSASATSSTTITLTWTGGSAFADEYIIEAKEAGASTFSRIGTADGAATTFAHTGLSAGDSFTYRIRARNGAILGSYSNEAAALIIDSGAVNGINFNGLVASIAVTGNVAYIGGNFSTVTDAGGAKTRNALCAIDLSTGLLTSWDPGCNAGSTVNALGLDSSGNVYAGGNFTTVAATGRNRAAAISAAGALLSWNPNLNSDCNALLVSGTTVYLGGTFTTADGGTARGLACAFNTSGTLLGWDPAVGTGGSKRVMALALTGGQVYIGGLFSDLNGGTGRNNAAAVDASTGVLSSWNPNMSSVVNCMATDGTNIYMGGAFTTVGGTARTRVASVSVDGVLQSLDPGPSAQPVGMAVSGSFLYVTGAFATINSQSRKFIAAVNKTSGAVASFDPGALTGVNVQCVTISGGFAVFGGDFTGGVFTNDIGVLTEAT